MRHILLFLLTLIIFSCQEKKEQIDNGEDLENTYIQEIGSLYYPESMNMRPVKIGPREEKNDYLIEIINSDSLDIDKNKTSSAIQNIAFLYKKHLEVNNRNPENIIVIVRQKKLPVKRYKFDVENLTE